MFLKINKITLAVFYFVLCFAWLTPNHYMPWLTSHNDFAMFFATFLLALYLLYQVTSLKVPHCVVYLWLLPLVPFIFLILKNNTFFGDAFISSMYILGFGTAVFIAYNLSYSLEKKLLIYKSLSYVLIIVSIITVGLQLMQWLMLSSSVFIVDLVPNGRPYANFAQPNNCVSFLTLGLIATLYLYEKHELNKFSGVLLTVFIILGIGLTQSRTFWIYSVCFLAWWLWKTHYFQTRLKTSWVFVFFIVYLMIIVILPIVSDTVGLVSTSSVVDRVSSGYSRVAMWKQLFVAVQQEPLLGYGWNQVSTAQLTVLLDYPTSEWTEHSHNILIDLVIWNGWPLGILIIVSIAYWLYRLSILATNVEVFIALAMVGAILVHAMLEYPLEYAFFLLPTGFLLGLIQSDQSQQKSLKISRRMFSVYLLFAFSIYAWVFIEYRMIEKDTQLARFELSNIGKIHAQDAAPNVILLTQLREQIRFMRTQPSEDMTNADLEWMRKVAYRYALPISLYRYAQALALNGHKPQAEEQLLKIKILYGRSYTYESLFVKDSSLAFLWKNEIAKDKNSQHRAQLDE